MMFEKFVNYCRMKSPWLLHVSCGSPRHTDIIVVTGIMSLKMTDVLKRLYEQTPEPKAVVAIGSCAITKGIFRETYASHGPADAVVPVDAYIPGCPPRPQAILHGVVTALNALWGG
ncbi:MAG: hypothetical protein AYK18_11020 [Theionarchaea archaeon DG-70]|nr:MAG: hypothetical protein AYK18_11020 [Theionarchaea archaeon DG-70]